jgi:hypothetical protein
MVSLAKLLGIRQGVMKKYKNIAFFKSIIITVGENLNFLTGINGALNFRINGT